MYLECHSFIYLGVNTSTRRYENIACMSGECIRTRMDFLKLLMEQIESYQQCDVYNIIHMDVCFEIRKSKTQIDKQVEKKIYTHDTDSRRQANREARNCCGLPRCL